MLQGLTPHVALARGGWMLLLYSSKTLGVAPRKSEKQRRLSRHYFVARKMPSVAWSQAFDTHMRDHFPLLMSSFGLPATGPELEPPAREGIGEVAPFAAIPYDAFRRGIHAVGSSCSTDLRGAAEAHLVQDPVLLQQPVILAAICRAWGRCQPTSLRLARHQGKQRSSAGYFPSIGCCPAWPWRAASDCWLPTCSLK